MASKHIIKEKGKQAMKTFQNFTNIVRDNYIYIYIRINIDSKHYKINIST